MGEMTVLARLSTNDYRDYIKETEVHGEHFEKLQIEYKKAFNEDTHKKLSALEENLPRLCLGGKSYEKTYVVNTEHRKDLLTNEDKIAIEEYNNLLKDFDLTELKLVEDLTNISEKKLEKYDNKEIVEWRRHHDLNEYLKSEYSHDEYEDLLLTRNMLLDLKERFLLYSVGDGLFNDILEDIDNNVYFIYIV
jgi:hypothetical protein